jgi:hypothetical protein
MISCRDAIGDHGRNLVISLWPGDKATINGMVHSGSPAPKDSECKNPLEKFSSGSIFWEQDGILLIDYLPKGRTISAEFHLSLLVQLKDFWKKNAARGKVTKRGLLRDKAPTHHALAIQKNLAYLGFQCLDQPAYSLDLAPLDYHLFPGL